MANKPGPQAYAGYIVVCDEGPMKIGPVLDVEEFKVANTQSYFSGVLWLADDVATLFPPDNHGPRAPERAIERTKAYAQELKLEWPWLDSAKVVPVRTNGAQDS